MDKLKKSKFKLKKSRNYVTLFYEDPNTWEWEVVSINLTSGKLIRHNSIPDKIGIAVASPDYQIIEEKEHL